MKERMLEILESQRDQYIADMGYRDYDCLYHSIAWGDIKTFKELAEYGVVIPEGEQ